MAEDTKSPAIFVFFTLEFSRAGAPNISARNFPIEEINSPSALLWVYLVLSL
jgi:hypothetical protein